MAGDYHNWVGETVVVLVVLVVLVFEGLACERLVASAPSESFEAEVLKAGSGLTGSRLTASKRPHTGRIEQHQSPPSSSAAPAARVSKAAVHLTRLPAVSAAFPGPDYPRSGERLAAWAARFAATTRCHSDLCRGPVSGGWSALNGCSHRWSAGPNRV